MEVFSHLIWLLCLSVVIRDVYSRSITKETDFTAKRCGSHQGDINQIVHKRYSRSLPAITNDRWLKKNLTYLIHNGQKPKAWYPSVSKERVGELVQQAFAEWAPHCGLRFEPWAPGAGTLPDITFSFKRGDHGDGEPFDGPGRKAAHAVVWSLQERELFHSDVHFDDDEIWSDAPLNDGEENHIILNFPHSPSLFPTLLHEIGHALGLYDLDDKNTIMYRFTTNFQHLTQRDKENMQHLYGISEDNMKASGPEYPTSTPALETTFTSTEEAPSTTTSELPSELLTSKPPTSELLLHD